MLPVFKVMPSVYCEPWPLSLVNPCLSYMNYVIRCSLTSSPNVKSVGFLHFSCRIQPNNAVLLWYSFFRLKGSHGRRGWALGEEVNRSSRFMSLRFPPCQAEPCCVPPVISHTFSRTRGSSEYEISRHAKTFKSTVLANGFVGHSISITVSWVSGVLMVRGNTYWQSL